MKIKEINKMKTYPEDKDKNNKNKKSYLFRLDINPKWKFIVKSQFFFF